MAGGLGPSIREGEILAAKYRLERELGRGAMGTVWSAMHLTLEQRVAIKFIGSEFADSIEARLRFRTEARAAAHLKSRYVVQVYDDGETQEGTPYIVMQYLEGETLEQRLEREGSVPLFDAVRITGHVARALRRAHARGIVHRDLKPGNIHLSRSDEDEHGWVAKVLDFGVAKAEGLGEAATTKPGAMLGTPLFMSPEQVQRASFVDHRADIYSLGMCFYNMVTGRYAFDSDSFTEVLMAICTQPLPSLGLQCPGLPPQVVSWFERCCARDPNARFQSAEEAFIALRSAAESAVPPNDHDETLRGHRAPLSQRSPPLGTTDSASYPGADASHRVVSPEPKRRTAMVLGVLGVTLVAAIGAIALVRLASGGEPHPASSAMALTAAPTLAPTAEPPPVAPEPVAVVPPSEPAPPEPGTPSTQPSTAVPARNIATRPAAPPKRPASNPAASSRPKNGRRTTDLGF